ncbi:MAG TPA: glycosyltransferase family 2 protein [Acidimicrobiia bacterium]|nr:glycosyltransferase family 2 protein [Acidimicrobiia bacterium]
MTPLLSVVMVTFGAREWVERALGALRAHTPVPYELIVVDNGSTDGTLDLLAGVEDAVVVAAGRNLGFGVANDLGVLHAHGDLLVLLNSDALVPDDWTRLFEWFDDPGVGAVVPQYVYPDGRLQEAGAAVHDDGLVAPFGVGDVPAWSFVRDVQYGSAACLVIRRPAFGALGGFDPAFAPAYYEDTDLTFRMWATHARVVFDPRVQVVHAQGASSESSTHAEERRDANRSRFVDRWRAELAGRPQVHGAPYPHHRVAARDFHAPDRVVVVTTGELVPKSDVVVAIEALAHALAHGRVSVLSHASVHPALDEQWRGLGIEHIELDPDDVAGWLEDRAGQCCVLVGDDAARAAHAPAWFASQGHHDHADLAVLAGAARDGSLDGVLLDHGLVPRFALLGLPGERRAAYPRPTEETA